ncbi:fatty acid desaturase family protein [Brevibacillus agri]|uniref:fatty acid desaturase family protein n=1 Tax=Brevibacillus agri TaxID=51101 RepID=UPI003D2085CC
MEIVNYHQEDSSQEGKSIKFSNEIMNQIRALQKKNNWYNFFSIGLDWLLIAGSIFMSQLWPNAIAYFAAIILIGGRMRGLDNLMHEASHGMLFKNRWMNKWVTSVFIAWPVFTDYTTYCKSHYLHHKYLWTDKDPDTSYLKSIGLDKLEISKRMFIFKYVLGALWIKHLPQNFCEFVQKLFLKKDQTNAEYFMKLGFWSIVLASSINWDFWLYLILYWLIPLITIFPIIRFWSDLSDHSGLETSHPLYSSRNSYGNIFERLILYPHHDTYHIVHHLFPYIPHYHLKKAHLILLKDPQYAKANHCSGFFKMNFPGFHSVIDDIIQKLNDKYKSQKVK